LTKPVTVTEGETAAADPVNVTAAGVDEVTVSVSALLNVKATDGATAAR
jgi:hypothetical protein